MTKFTQIPQCSEELRMCFNKDTRRNGIMTPLYFVFCVYIKKQSMKILFYVDFVVVTDLTEVTMTNKNDQMELAKLAEQAERYNISSYSVFELVM
jgi:hypothetical protein